MARLRTDAGDDSDTKTTAFVAIGLAVFAALAAPTVALGDVGVQNSIAVVFALIVLGPVMLAVVKQERRRTQARTWASAFEDELNRRWSATGRSARKWKAARRSGS